LTLTPEGVRFRNGLRDVTLAWEDIQSVQVQESPLGKRVQVQGAEARFAFRTLGEVRVQGDLKGQMGFREGEAILKHILKSGGLQASGHREDVRYYTRP